MISLDTNVLVRLVVDDPEAAEQGRRARELVETAVEGGDTIFLTNIVLCEFVWVLRRAYRVGRCDVVRSLKEIFSTERMIFESSEAVGTAITHFEAGPADFADYLLCDIAMRCGCDKVYSFDGDLVASGRAEMP